MGQIRDIEIFTAVAPNGISLADIVKSEMCFQNYTPLNMCLVLLHLRKYFLSFDSQFVLCIVNSLS